MSAHESSRKTRDKENKIKVKIKRKEEFNSPPAVTLSSFPGEDAILSSLLDNPIMLAGLGKFLDTLTISGYF